MYRYGLQKMTNHNLSYWWNLSGNCIFVLLYRMDLNCWKGSCLWGFRNFRLPCESKSAIFQGTLTPFALFPYCSKGLPGKCIWFKESGGGVSEELSCKGKPYKIVLRIFSPPTAEASNLWQGADFYFFYVTFHSAPFGLREYLCDSSYSERARAECTGLALPLQTSDHNPRVNHRAVLDVKMICRWAVIPISSCRAEMVNYEKRQAALHLNPSTVRVISVRNTFSGFGGAEKAGSHTDGGQGHCSPG